MTQQKTDTKTEKNRQYSPVYEKIVPVAIGVIVILVIGMLLLAGAIALDIIPLG